MSSSTPAEAPLVESVRSIAAEFHHAPTPRDLGFQGLALMVAEPAAAAIVATTTAAAAGWVLTPCPVWMTSLLLQAHIVESYATSDDEEGAAASPASPLLYRKPRLLLTAFHISNERLSDMLKSTCLRGATNVVLTHCLRLSKACSALLTSASHATGEDQLVSETNSASYDITAPFGINGPDTTEPRRGTPGYARGVASAIRNVLGYFATAAIIGGFEDLFHAIVRRCYVSTVASVFPRVPGYTHPVEWADESSRDWNPLHIAALAGASSELLDRLIIPPIKCRWLSGIGMADNWEALTTGGMTAVEVAIRYSPPGLLSEATRRAIAFLIDAGCSLTHACRDGTALHLAARRSDPELIRLLLAKGADPKSTLVVSLEPLVYAVRQNSPVAVKALLELVKPDAHSIHAALVEARKYDLQAIERLLQHYHTPRKS